MKADFAQKAHIRGVLAERVGKAYRHAGPEKIVVQGEYAPLLRSFRERRRKC